MQTVKIIAMGKLKEDYLRAACAEYTKRLQAFCKLEIIELEPQRSLELEAKLLQAKLGKQASVCALCVEGRPLTSEDFAAWLAKQPSEVNLLIGSSHGLCESIKARANLRLSMSAMTLPHQLARVMLLEQVYRACSINGGGKYHK
ncbi:MAG: 23S rRNA (pseudouridine(1915)-N(3))-methyltransferase RlmH [Oscillospiraceae bacterium]|nr:23S rRNA (pseudouridine(1915)-N(3))-methyltransferase RlmH [Oscillospiraceae bacterium]